MELGVKHFGPLQGCRRMVSVWKKHGPLCWMEWLKVSPAPCWVMMTHVSVTTRELFPLFFLFPLWELGDTIALRAILPNFWVWRIATRQNDKYEGGNVGLNYPLIECASS